jgi:excinuclease ABC subunit A
VALIQVRGARTHNLADVDLELDPRAFTVLVGRSGSGKSSFAFDTLHAEGLRRYLQALSHRVRQAAEVLPRPDVDVITGLPPTVALRQRAGRRSGRGRIGSASEVDELLRLLFGRAGTQHDPVSGDVLHTDTHDTIVAKLMSLGQRVRVLVEAPVVHSGHLRGVMEEVARAGFSRVRVDGEVLRLEEVDVASLSEQTTLRVVVDRIRISSDKQGRLYDAVRTATTAGQGVMVAVDGDGREHRFTDRPVSTATGETLPLLSPDLFRARGPDACSDCGGTGWLEDAVCETCSGTGLGAVALAVRWQGWGWSDLRHAALDQWWEDLLGWPRTPVTSSVLEELVRRVGALRSVGLGHLSLDRTTATLSSGEVQRLQLARQISSELAGVLMVLDEPTAGLDDASVDSVVALMKQLQRDGNGLVVVEHHPKVIAVADRVVEFGPGAGEIGGRVVFDGPPSALAHADTVTGAWWRRERTLTAVPSPARGRLVLKGATRHGLPGDDIVLQKGSLNAVVGPSGSGKTALLEALGSAARGDEADDAGALTGASFDKVITVQASSASKMRRSMPATYVGLWSVMRELFASTAEAQVRGLAASSFSLNVKGGRCEACKGLGTRRIELQFLPAVEVRCEVCDGRRFSRDVLEVRWKGLDAGALLALDADTAHPILAGHPRLDACLRALKDVGLGYVPLGQGADTLSGGEAKRMTLARELVRLIRHGGSGTLFLLDAPTAGLHPEDVAGLHELLVRLVEEGATVVVSTHHAGLVGVADHVVTLG